MGKAELFEKLLRVAMNAGGRGITIGNFDSEARGLNIDGNIGLSGKMNLDQINETLAHEIAHSYLHYDKGNTLESKRHAEYEEQADRAAKMLLSALAC